MQAWLLVQTDVTGLWEPYLMFETLLLITVERPIGCCLSPLVCLGQTFNINTSSNTQQR